MIEVNKENVDLNCIVSKKELRTANFIVGSYRLLKLLGAGLAGAAGISFGLTFNYLIIIVGILTTIISFKKALVDNAKALIKEVETGEFKLMVDIANAGVKIDADNFNLEKVAESEDMKDVKIVVSDVKKDGTVEKVARSYGSVGNKYKYYAFKDADNKSQFLVDTEHFYEENQLIGKNSYITNIVSNIKTELLEESDLFGLPEKVQKSITEYLNPVNKSVKKKKKTLSK